MPHQRLAIRLARKHSWLTWNGGTGPLVLADPVPIQLSGMPSRTQTALITHYGLLLDTRTRTPSSSNSLSDSYMDIESDPENPYHLPAPKSSLVNLL